MPSKVSSLEPVVEQPHPVAEEDRDDVQLEFVEQPEGDHLAEQAAASGDRDVLVPAAAARARSMAEWMPSVT